MADEEDNVPCNEEHMEAVQGDMDKKRYEYITSLSPEEQTKFKTMEECVEKMIGLKCPFMFLMNVEKDSDRFWRYQSMTPVQLPTTGKDTEDMMRKSWYAMQTHAKHFSKLSGHTISFMTKEGTPFYQVKPNSDIMLKAEIFK